MLFLAGKTGVVSTQYNGSGIAGYVAYADSMLCSVANNYENTFTDINSFLMKSLVKSTTFKGVTSKIFPATREQILFGGFSYFNSESRRKLSVNWWLADNESTTSGKAHVIDTTGAEQTIHVIERAAFRPFLTLRTV